MFKVIRSVFVTKQESKAIEAARYLEAQHNSSPEYTLSQREFIRDFHEDRARYTPPSVIYPTSQSIIE
jgi:hypothetical protein